MQTSDASTVPASIAAELDAARAEVVDRIGDFTFTRGEITDAFNLVADKANWKNPINAVVEFRSARERIALHRAVEFFTGSRPTLTFMKFVPNDSGTGSDTVKYRVTAAGYYAAIGA